MKKMINESHVEGLLYEHKLELKVSGENSKHPGTQFISGTVSVATDDECLNVIEVHYTYVTATTSKGNPDSRWTVLKNIIDGVYGTIMTKGKESAAKVRIDSAIGLNDFYVEREGQETLVSAKRNEGGFIRIVDALSEDEKTRNTFKVDMVITNVSHIEANEERNFPEKAVIKGAVFDFRNALMPVEFSAVNAGAINYFESLDASPKNPVFTKVWGRQISETVVRKIVEESAFGDASVREVRNSHKDWVITGASTEPYVWDDESTITAAELTKAMADRETYLAGIKQRRDEYLASKNGGSSAPSGGFNF